jgi:hypothetical protein
MNTVHKRVLMHTRKTRGWLLRASANRAESDIQLGSTTTATNRGTATTEDLTGKDKGSLRCVFVLRDIEVDA